MRTGSSGGFRPVVAASLGTVLGLALVAATLLHQWHPAGSEVAALPATPHEALAARAQVGFLSGRGSVWTGVGAPLPAAEVAPDRHASSRGTGRQEDLPPPMPAPEVTPAAVPSEPPPTPTPAPEPKKAVTYEVASGDTLNGLAQRFGVSSETILWANDLANGGATLQVGQELTIPPVSGVMHKVQKGDTLVAIARQYEVSPQAIIEANALSTPDVLSIDQELIIPGGKRAPAPAPMPQAGGLEHRVVAGETVAIIARRYGVDSQGLVRANGLDDPDTIRVGQLLVIPGAAPTAAPPPPTAAETAPPPPTAEPAAAPPPQAADKGQEIVAIASRYLGYPYAWAGQSPSTGFDCSGFAWYVYQQAGIELPTHDAAGQLAAGPLVGRGELLPGDLVFFQNTYKAGLSHVGIYAGDGRFIHSANESLGVRFDALDSAYYDVRYYGACRPW